MLVFKLVCDEGHKMNVDLIANKFSESIGKSRDVTVKKGDNSVKIYIGQKGSNNISLPIIIEDSDVENI